MRRLPLLFWLIVGVDALRHIQSEIFKKTSEVTMTRSRWMINFLIDIRPYKTLLEKLQYEITRAKNVREKVWKDYSSVKEKGLSETAV